MINEFFCSEYQDSFVVCLFCKRLHAATVLFTVLSVVHGAVVQFVVVHCVMVHGVVVC